jgi:hypothetical protein
MTLIRKPYELKTQSTVKALIYGQPGAGKTTLALSAPKVLLLDFDGGIHRINPLHQVDTVQIESWEDCINVLNEDLSMYQTIVIDTVGKALDFLSVYLIKNEPKLGRKDGALTLQGFGSRKYAFIAFMSKVSMMGKNLIFVAHEKEEKDGDQKIIRPEIGGSSAGDLIKELDLVGYMELIGQKMTISFNPCEKYYGKNTCNLEPVIEIPRVNGSANVLFSLIVDQYKNGLESRQKLAFDYNVIIENIKEQLEPCADSDSLNSFVEMLSKNEHIWDSKLQGGLRANDKAKELGLVLNKTSKKYEPAKVKADDKV